MLRVHQSPDTRTYFSPLLCRFFLLFLVCTVTNAHASIEAEGTRLIFFGKDKEVSISVTNQASEDVLLQSWVSHEDDSDTSDIPFAIIRPLVQLGGHERHLLRILYAGEGLPSDRESLFWLNIMEIPLKAKDSDSMQFAIRQRMKFFYRPPGLQGSASESVQNLTWEYIDGQVIKVSNSSLFHLSLVDIEIDSINRKQRISDYLLLKPGESHLIQIPSTVIGVGTKIDFTEITDIGLQARHSASLQ